MYDIYDNVKWNTAFQKGEKEKLYILEGRININSIYFFRVRKLIAYFGFKIFEFSEAPPSK